MLCGSRVLLFLTVATLLWVRSSFAAYAIDSEFNPEGYDFHPHYERIYASNDLDSLEFYRGRRKILFLAEKASETSGLAERVAAAYPRTLVVRTGIDAPPIGSFPPNCAWAVVDNRYRLPFPDNNFDLIVMRRGLCLCGERREITCGGISIDEDSGRRFFTEVSRVLDKRSRQSLALLDAGYNYHSTPRVVQVWENASRRVMERSNVRIQIGIDVLFRMFTRVTFQPK